MQSHRRWRDATRGGRAAAVGIFGSLVVLSGVPALRRRTLSRGLLGLARRLKLVPRISETERAALEAGDTWIEQDLFRGKPDWERLQNTSPVRLTDEEQAFLDGPVERLCALVKDWQVWRDRDLTPQTWSFIRAHGFLGMIIPKEYGGLGFSAAGHSAVIKKLHSRSIPLSISVMVPNSLGPAELLLHYGTAEQKRHYLPRLASGQEIPCFALTEPEAGSDAASIRSEGEVFRGPDGRLYLRLNWEKRWITLATAATVIGLAFRLKDPGNVLGKGVEPGITCALIPRNTAGVQVDRRHDPMGVPFYNSPTTGKDVIVRLEPTVIGGLAGVGRGWAMLMESLAAGRGISIPAQCAGEAAWVARVAGAYARVRRQFGLPIGRFEGVAEAVGKIGGLAYIVEALRAFTCAALNSGKRPAIVTAMVKCQSTELLRRILNHGMDVLGGVGLSLGPRNLLAHAYIAAPIAITVEGANILTRSLIVFGQGVLRLHPAIYREVSALQKKDAAAFDSAWTRHLLFAFRNAARGAGAFLFQHRSRGKGARRRLERASAIFAALSELTILTLGGKLKFSEKLSGRFADALGWMVAVCAVLHRYESDGSREEDRPFVEWSLERAFAEIQYALEGILMNHPAPVLGAFLRRVTAPLLRINRIGFAPSDHQELEIARLLMSPGPQRERLFGGIYLPLSSGEPAGRLEAAMRLAARAEPLEAKRRENLPLSSGELELIEQARRARVGAVQVDSFAFDEYKKAGKRAA